MFEWNFSLHIFKITACIIGILDYDVPQYGEFTLNRSASMNDLGIATKHAQISSFPPDPYYVDHSVLQLW